MMNQNKIFGFMVIVILVFTIGGCVTAPTQSTVSSQKEITLKDVCKRNGVFWQWDSVAQVATLEYRGAKAEVLVGSDLVIVNNERVTLNAPVRVARSTVIVPADFQSKVISRLRQKMTVQKGHGITKIREIIIDAGHGGKDPGAIGRSGEHEKKIVLDISKRLKRILQDKGIKVIMTREGDQFISLQKRTEIASRSKADLFVSIHANSSPSRGIHGLEIYTAKHLKFNERNADQRKINQRLTFSHLAMEQGRPELNRIVSDMMYTHKQAQAEALAKQVAKKTAKSLKTKNRGEKKSRFFVVKNTLIPAVLIEVGFLTNPKESKLLQTGTYRQRVARGIAESILDYAND